MKKTNNKDMIRLVAGVGIFAALAIIVSYATSFIKVQFLSLDAGDIIIVLASFIYGPVSGIVISAISALVSFVYSGTGPWGMLMDFISSAVFSFVAAALYSKHRNFKWAIIGIYSSVIAVSVVMIPMNILITPIYTGAPTTAIIKLIPALLLPFNLFKALFNGGAVLLIYKPLIKGMRAARLVSASKNAPKSDSYTPSPWVAPVLGTCSILVAAIVLVILSLI